MLTFMLPTSCPDLDNMAQPYAEQFSKLAIKTFRTVASSAGDKLGMIVIVYIAEFLRVKHAYYLCIYTFTRHYAVGTSS